MIITDVRATTVAVPIPNTTTAPRLHKGLHALVSVLVEVQTDEGLVGIGESPAVLGGDLTEAIISSAAPAVIGNNPLHVNRIMKTLYARYNLTHLHLHAANWALNALDVALWDLAGKSVGRSLYELWGGPFRRDVTFYGDVQRQEPAAMAEEACSLAAAGFTTLYTKVGLDTEDDLAAVAALREGASSDRVKIRVDANQSWSTGEAIRMITAMADYGLEFVDQPVLMYNLEALRRVRDAVPVPIAAHESGWTMYEALNVIKAGAADVLHVDPYFDAGLAGARITAGIAEAAGIPVVLHSYGLLGVAFTAGLHLIASCPNFTLANQEVSYRRLEEDVIVGGPLPFQGATVRVPDGPGLGVALDPDRVRYYADYYRREIRDQGQERDLHTTLYKAMYLRPYLKETGPDA